MRAKVEMKDLISKAYGHIIDYLDDNVDNDRVARLVKRASEALACYLGPISSFYHKVQPVVPSLPQQGRRYDCFSTLLKLKDRIKVCRWL